MVPRISKNAVKDIAGAIDNDVLLVEAGADATKPVTLKNCRIRSRSPSACSSTASALSAQTAAAATASGTVTELPSARGM